MAFKCRRKKFQDDGIKNNFRQKEIKGTRPSWFSECQPHQTFLIFTSGKSADIDDSALDTESCPNGIVP